MASVHEQGSGSKRPDPLKPLAGDGEILRRLRDDEQAVRNLLILLASLSATPNNKRLATIAKESADAIRVIYNELH